jgi:hypothetical protein
MTNNDEWKTLRKEYDAAIDAEEMATWEKGDPVPEPQPPNCNYCHYFKESACVVSSRYFGDTPSCPLYTSLFVI